MRSASPIYPIKRNYVLVHVKHIIALCHDILVVTSLRNTIMIYLWAATRFYSILLPILAEKCSDPYRLHWIILIIIIIIIIIVIVIIIIITFIQIMNVVFLSRIRLKYLGYLHQF